MVFVIYFLNKEQAIFLFSALLLFILMFEYLRMSCKPIQNLTKKILGRIMRVHEDVTVFKFSALSGSFYFTLAVLTSVVLFPKNIAITSILIMIFSDTMAALIGKTLGKHKILDKSIEGCLAFLITTIILLYLYDLLSTYEIILISFILTLVELYSKKLKIDDNLSITLISGSLLLIFS